MTWQCCVQAAVLRQEDAVVVSLRKRRSCVDVNSRESACAVTKCFNKPSSHSKMEPCPSVVGVLSLVL